MSKKARGSDRGSWVNWSVEMSSDLPGVGKLGVHLFGNAAGPQEGASEAFTAVRGALSNLRALNREAGDKEAENVEGDTG